MKITSARTAASLAAAALLLVSACSSKTESDDSGSGGGSGDGAVETDFGVTDDTITLAISAALTGPFAASSQSIVGGAQVLWDQVNADGGVCGRQVELEIVDNGYDAQKSVAAYQGFKDNVLGIQAITGTPSTAAVLPSLEQDNILSAVVSWSTSLLANPQVMMVGSTFDIEMINGVSYLLENAGLQEGDTVGFIGFQNEYGATALRGAQYAAELHDITIVEQQIAPTDVDLSAQFGALRQANAHYVLMAAGGAQSGSMASLAQAAGYDLTIMSANPGFTPSLMDGPAADALAENYFQVQSWLPLSSDETSEIYDAFVADNPDATPDHYVVFAYAQGLAWQQVLESACEDGDLTRAGVNEAFRGLDTVDTQGITAPLDFSQEGQPSTREAYIVQPDPDSTDRLTVVQELAESADAQDYEVSQ